MEGNECYKFSTIKNYLLKTGAPPIRVAVDVGCNLGEVTAMMREYFPGALVFAFEPVDEYYLRACRRLSDDPMVKVLPAAVTAAHRFADDLGEHPRSSAARLRIFRALAASGPGWVGGSQILHEQDEVDPDRYARLDAEVATITLDEIVDSVCALTGAAQIDYLKMDCEGCENSALGCARPETLARIRYLSGEYHDVNRFYGMTKCRLSRSHRVNLVGDYWGGFFAERRDLAPAILEQEPHGVLVVPDACDDGQARYHRFREDYVFPEERQAHGLRSQGAGLVNPS